MKKYPFYIQSVILLLLVIFLNGSSLDNHSSAPPMSGYFTLSGVSEKSLAPSLKHKVKSNTGHYQLLLDESHSSDVYGQAFAYYSVFIDLAESLGFTVTVGQEFENIMDYDVVVLLLPQSSFSESDITLLTSYLDSGKILWVFGEWGVSGEWTNTSINELLSNLNSGIQIRDAEIIDRTDYFEENAHILISDFSDHCLVEGLTTIIHPRAGYLTVTNPDSGLYYSDSDSYDHGHSAILGPFVMGAVADPAVHPGWRMFVTADLDLFSSPAGHFFISLYDNAAFAENLLFWCGCTNDADCDDGLFCNGQESCDTVLGCVSADNPCRSDQTCSEETDQCLDGDDTSNDFTADDTDELVSDDESDPGWPEGNVTGGCCGG